MLSSINQTKYCNSIVNELQDYMLFKRAIDEAFKCVASPNELVRIGAPYKQNKQNKQNEQTEQKEKVGHVVEALTSKLEATARIYRPHQPDSLFWCLYILLHGGEAYETVNIENRPFMVENREKIKMVDLVRANKQTIKHSKLGSITNIESDLSIAGKSISTTTFATICILHGIEVLFIDKTNNTFCEVAASSVKSVNDSISPTINIVYKSDSSLRFECELNVPKDVAQSKHSDFFQLHSINKPIKPISSFTTSELIETCKLPSLRLPVKDNLGKPLSKRDMYNELTSKLGLNED